MEQIGKRTAEAGLVIMMFVLISSFFIGLNGGSLDFSDREIRVVVTDSMDGEPQPYDIPTIPRNALVMFTHTGAVGIDIGDVAAYRTTAAGQPVFHRVVGIDRSEGQYILKGDSLPFSDRVPQDDIIGKVTGTDPLAGSIILFVKSFIPFLLVLIPAFIVLRHALSILGEDGNRRYSR